MAMTLAQKILQMHTEEEIREPGQIVECSLSGVLANDITGPLAIKSFHAMGAKKVFDKDRVFLVMDHYTPQKDIASANQVIVSRRKGPREARRSRHRRRQPHLHLRRHRRVLHGPRLHGYRLRHGARQTVVQGARHHPREH